MRYKTPEDSNIVIPPEQLADNASNDMLLLTAAIGFVIGLLFLIGGRWGKQLWIWVWGIGLMLTSAYLAVSLLFDVTLFGHF